MLAFMKCILSKQNRFWSAGKTQGKQMAKIQNIGSKFLQLKLILSVPHCKYLCFPTIYKPSNLKLGHCLYLNEFICPDEPAQLQ